MSGLSHSLLTWAGAAVALFWFVGAHNRLVRLRSAALQAYAALDALLVRQLDFVQASLDAPPPEGEASQAAVSALQAAAGQALTVLGATRARPLDPAAMGALATALRVLLAAWERVHPDELVSFEADGTLSRPASLLGPRESGAGASSAPAAAPMAWPEPSALVEITRAQFNAAVLQYNAAIRQFPAVFVAWAFRLRAAAPLI
ncbi:MAG: hypothetical protein REJ24_21435 [Rhodocyclaceae bacterium]|nr:lema family protein [Pseudomonadota bacterium]MDQ7975155.1 hypothetical protein [Rhodocyclaceae bacterium]MDQ8001810.1 lema family protein [Pseudomonadota bacterium]MDQ8020022.1 lema family protein [Pseudomonadota bacterium]